MNWVEKVNVAGILLMEFVFLVALFKVGNDEEGWTRYLIKAYLLLQLSIIPGMLLYNAMAAVDPQDSSTTTAMVGAAKDEGIDGDYDGSRQSPTADLAPTYSDRRWPTANTELLAIPEADRWYNSRTRVGSHGTIAGPVKSVVYLDDRVMVNIGADFPDTDRAQIVIWAERWEDFQDILNEIDVGDPWVSVSGEIGEFDGVAQIDVNDSNTRWRLWTDVE